MTAFCAHFSAIARRVPSGLALAVIAASLGFRHGLQASARAMQSLLQEAGFSTPALSGNIVTASSTVLWSDRPPRNLEVLPFRMPRMYGS